MKKYIIFLIGFVSLLSCKKESPAPVVPSDWIPVASLPLNEERIGAVSFSIGNKGYITTGHNMKTEILESDLWMYNPESNIWTQKANLPFNKRRISATCFVIGTKMYLFGGRDQGNDPVCDLWEYDSETNMWAEKPSLPVGNERYGASGFSVGGKGYIVGGAKSINNDFGDLWEYDPQTETWTPKASLPDNDKRSYAAVFVLNDIAYFSGGSGHSDCWQYNPQTDIWEEKASVPYPRNSPAAFALDGKGYLICGTNPNAYQTDSFLQYDPQTDQWIEKTPFPEKRRAPEMFFVLDGFAYVGGGMDANTAYRDLYKFNPTE